MPLIEYRCPSCRKSFEHLQRSARDKARCPSCGGGRLERLLSVFGVSTGAASMPALSCRPQGCDAPACGTGPCGFG